MKDLPKGWATATVGELAEVVQYGSSAKTEAEGGGVPVLRMGNIVDGKLDLSNLKYLPEKHYEFPDLILKSGDLLFNRTNSLELVGKSAVYKGEPSRCSFASYLIRLRLSHAYKPELLAAFLNSPRGRQWAREVATAQVGQANVNGTKLQALEIPVPPRSEQDRIVKEIETQFSRLDAGVEALKRVQAQLKRYRASVLRAACEGRLVPTDGIWTTKSFGEITENFDGRRVPVKAKDRAERQGDYPYYGASGIIDRVDDFLFDGDFLLVAEDGANLLSRSTPIAFPASGKFWVNNHAHVVRPVPSVSIKFLELALNALDLKFAVTGSAQPKLTQAALNRIEIALPPEDEQLRIVGEVERLLSGADQVVTAVRANLKRADAMKRAMLREAFDGRLVPQDPRDEPAHRLLERIADRAAGEPPANNHRRRGTKRTTEKKAIA